MVEIVHYLYITVFWAHQFISCSQWHTINEVLVLQLTISDINFPWMFFIQEPTVVNVNEDSIHWNATAEGT